VSLDFDKRKFLLFQLGEELFSELERVRVVDVVVSAGGGELNTYFVSTVNANKSIKSFKAETNSVGNASTVLVGSLVSTVLQELINEISVSSVEFKSIETSFLSVLSTLSEFFNDFLDVFFSHLLRYWMRSLGVSMRGSNCNSTRSNRGLSTEEVSESCTTTMPDLEDNFTTLFMHFLGDLLPSFNLLFAVDTT
jgi:fluoride ion exporter CrcB/FEX